MHFKCTHTLYVLHVYMYMYMYTVVGARQFSTDHHKYTDMHDSHCNAMTDTCPHTLQNTTQSLGAGEGGGNIHILYIRHSKQHTISGGGWGQHTYTCSTPLGRHNWAGQTGKDVLIMA